MVEVTLKDIQMLKQDVILNRLPQWKDCWFDNSSLKEKADSFYFIHAAEDFWTSQDSHKNDDSHRETLVYYGYW